MGDEGDRQMKWGQRERRCYSIGEQKSRDTVGGGDDSQIQGAKRKSMLVGRTKSRHGYLEGA